MKLLVGGAAVAMLAGLVACFCPLFWPAVAAFWAPWLVLRAHETRFLFSRRGEPCLESLLRASLLTLESISWETSFWKSFLLEVFNMLGAALMPGAFGLMLNAVYRARRPMASAMAQLPINLLGMAGGR